MAMLVISVIGAGVLLLGLFNKSNKIIIGLVVAAVATVFIRAKKITKEAGG